MNKQDKKEIMNLIKYKKMLGGRRMTNLEKWKQEKIKEIEKMDIEDVTKEILEGNDSLCAKCAYRDDCDTDVYIIDCEKGINEYLKSEYEIEFSEFVHAKKAMGLVLTIGQYRQNRDKIKPFYSEKAIEHIEDFGEFKSNDTKFILCNDKTGHPMMYLNAVSFIDRIPFDKIKF